MRLIPQGSKHSLTLANRWQSQPPGDPDWLREINYPVGFGSCSDRGPQLWPLVTN
jgi:hypothetical protein